MVASTATLQLRAPVDEADWHVYFFGVCSEDYDADRPPPPGGDVLPLPAAARPAASLVPVEKKNDGKTKPPAARENDLDDEIYTRGSVLVERHEDARGVHRNASPLYATVSVGQEGSSLPYGLLPFILCAQHALIKSNDLHTRVLQEA